MKYNEQNYYLEMFPHDIILNISSYLPYGDYISLISTCSDYYNNEYIRSNRRNKIISKHGDLTNFLYLSISINDINTIELLTNASNKQRLFFGDNFIDFLVGNTNYEIFKIIEAKIAIKFYLPPALKYYNTNKFDGDWDYVLNIIKSDREDIMLSFLKNREREVHIYDALRCTESNLIFNILEKCLKHSSYKNISVILKDEHLSNNKLQIHKLILNELSQRNVDVVKIFIKNYTDIDDILPKLLEYPSLKLSLLNSLGY